MRLTNIRLGDYIERSTKNNADLSYGEELISGVSSKGIFSKPKGSTKNVNLKPYKIVNNGAFVYNPTRLNIGSLAYRTEGLCIVSHLYMVFYLNERGLKLINPIYLYIYFHRDEFQREVTFRNFGSQRPEFNFKDISEIIIPIPPIEIQEKYVAIYKSMLENQKAYERGLEDLKLTCDGYLEQLKKSYKFESIGEYISESNERNEKLEIDNPQGIDIHDGFIEPKRIAKAEKGAKIVRTGAFAYNKVIKANGTRIPIGYREKEDCTVSSSYNVFKVDDDKKMKSKYLMLWLSRLETQRRVGFNAWGSTRDTISFNDLCEVKIPIPPIEVQKSIAGIYTVYKQRQEINEKLKVQIKDICPILIKGSLDEARRS